MVWFPGVLAEFYYTGKQSWDQPYGAKFLLLKPFRAHVTRDTVLPSYMSPFEGALRWLQKKPANDKKGYDLDENVLSSFVRLVWLDVRFLTFLIVSASLRVLLPVLLRLENPAIRFCSLRSVESFSLTVSSACPEECSMWAWREGRLCSCLVL